MNVDDAKKTVTSSWSERTPRKTNRASLWSRTSEPFKPANSLTLALVVLLPFSAVEVAAAAAARLFSRFFWAAITEAESTSLARNDQA